MPIDLESLTSSSFAKLDEKLGDTIIVTPPSAAAISFKAHVDYGDREAEFGQSAAVVQDIVIDFAMDRVTGMPGKGWRITLPLIPGKSFEPLAVRRDESGTRWVMGVKDIPGV